MSLNFFSLVIAGVAITLTLPATAQESLLYSFPSAAVGDPVGHLLLHKNALYGATTGASSSLGTVFELRQSGGAWKETTIHAFDGSDGAYPAAGLISDSSGTLYGTTSSAGSYNGGTLFTLSQSGKRWTEQTLWNFGNTQINDGVAPACALLTDSSGAIYGTTEAGGTHNLGTVFKLTNSGGAWTETVLYSFAGGSDGQDPDAGLAMDRSGVLYGITYYGGAKNEGTAFALVPSGKAWSERVLHSFGKGTDGRNPDFASLVLAANGALYGTTLYGGSNDWGTVFELTPSGSKWKEKIVHTFGSGSDGRAPDGALIRSESGILYGTTTTGGQNFGGTVYQLVNSGGTWSETILSNFPNVSGDGYFPEGGVVVDTKSGTSYGTTEQGGADGWGTIYQIVL